MIDITDDSVVNERIKVLQDCEEDQDQAQDLSGYESERALQTIRFSVLSI